MTDQPQDNAGQPQDATGEAPRQPGTGSPQWKAAAAQAVGEVQAPDQGTDAGASIDEMAKLRAGLSDYEKQLAAMMRGAEEQQAQWAKQFDLMQRQLATVRQQAGPPVATLLADSLATRVQSIAQAHPDLGAQHFAGVISQAAALADEVKSVADGSASGTQRAEQLAHGIGTWFTRAHPRISGKFLEGMHAAVDEAERILEELPNLVPAAAAIARVL